MTTTTPPRPRRLPFTPTDRVVHLPERALACRGCGLAVTRPLAADVEDVTINVRPLGGGFGAMTRSVPLTRCSRCVERRDRAAALVALHNLVRIYGTVAIDNLDAALAALEVLGIGGDRSKPLTRTRQDARMLIDIMGQAGGAALFTRYLTEVGLDEVCAPRPWAHVSSDVIAGVQAAYGRLRQRALEMPTPVPPPSGGLRACLYCGTGQVEALPREAGHVWGPLRDVNPAMLSAKPVNRSANVRGSLCRVCDGDVEWRPLGERSVQHALASFLGYEVRSGTRLEGIPGMGAWASQRPDGAPNETPWGHIDTAMVRKALERLRRAQLVRRLDEEWPTAPLIVGWVNPRAEVTR